MAVSRFWFSAYPNYTVDQIERHARIAERVAESHADSEGGRRMGEGSVTGHATRMAPASWRLQPPDDALTQGIVVSGFSDLLVAKALFLKCDWPPDAAGIATGRGSWLTTLQRIAPITDADGKRRARGRHRFHLDRACEVGPCARCARELFAAVSRGHVPRRPAPPPWRQDRRRVASYRYRGRTVVERQQSVRVPIPSPPAGVDGPALPPSGR